MTMWTQLYKKGLENALNGRIWLTEVPSTRVYGYTGTLWW
jgi:hypothetical protein